MQLQDFASLAAAQAYPEIPGQKLSADLMRSYLNDPTVQLYDYFKSAITSSSKTDVGGLLFNIGDLKMTVFDNMQSGGEFNFITGHPSDQTSLVDVLIFTETNAALKSQLSTLKSICLAYCNKQVYPFINATQLQFNQAKKIYTEKEVVGWVYGKNVKVTLVDVLPFDCQSTTWDNDAIFGYENVGRAAHLDTTKTVYKIDMSTVKVDGKLMIRIPVANYNFIVELI